jgi:hypothetical protein
MKFRYIGATEPNIAWGITWYHGDVHDVTDDHACRKLSNHPEWEMAEGAPSAPKASKPLPAALEKQLAKAATEPPKLPQYDEFGQAKPGAQPPAVVPRRGRPPKVTLHPKYDDGGKR